jgi:hypothetical protein
MKKLAVIFLLLSAPAIGQDKGPLPQTGLEHPEVTKGAKESGAMDIRKDKAKGTTGMNKRPKEKNGPAK